MKRRPGFLRGIRGRLTLFFCLLFALILAAVLLASTYGIPGTGYHGRAGHLRADALRSLELVADGKKERLLFWLHERRSAVNFVAANELVEAGTLELLEGFRRAEGSEPWRSLRSQPEYASLLRFFYKIKGAYGFYESIQIADAATGRILVSTVPEHLGLDISSSLCFSGTLKARGGHVSDLEYLHAEKSPSFFFGDVIRDPGGEIVAVLLLEVDAEKAIRPVLDAGASLGEGAEALLVNGRAQVVTALRHRLADGSRARPLVDRIGAEPARRAARGEEGHLEVEDYRGEPVLAAYRHLPVTPDWGWGLVVKVDSRSLFGHFRQDLAEASLLALCGIAIVVLFTAALSGKLSRPILLLARTAEGFAAGDLSVRSGFRRSDEIGGLAGVFDTMAERVQAAMAELEERQKLQEDALGISSVLAASGDLEELLEKGLSELLTVTKSQVGAVYLADGKSPGTFRLGKAFGQGPLPGEVRLGEGSLGLAAQRRRVEVLVEIPEETRFTIRTIAGESLPNAVVNVPLIFQERVVGILALASLYPYGSGKLEVLEMTRTQLATAINNALTHGETVKLAADLQSKNEELQVQAEELQAQSEELRSQSEELRSQSEEMRAHTDELVAQQRRVEEADRLKSEFLSNMSHELRTPLNSIMALTQLMIARGPGKNPEQEPQYLAVIERNGRNLLNLINDILDISKIEAGHMEICHADFAPRHTLERVMETVRPLLEAKGLKSVLSAEDLPLMRSDEGRVYQILLNLLSNAVKFTESGEIEVKVFKEGEAVLFAVRDTGIGIAEKEMAHIFDEFRQVDGSTTRRHEGTGLGLAICRKLARLLGGEVSARSEAGRGSVFTLSLPAELPGHLEEGDLPEKPSAPPVQRRQGACGKVAHVLVVEDNPVAQLQIRSALEERGHCVEVASGGEEGLASIGQKMPDAVVLDLMMPGVDGFEALESIRSNPATAALPVLVLSAKELTAEERARLNRDNFSRILRKGSLDREELIAAVESLIEGERPGGYRPGPILLVEDNPDNRLTLQALLDEMGHSHLTAEDGEKALDLIGKADPALVLMDIHLPLLSGLDVTRRLKADPATEDIPVIALTARAMVGDRESFLAAGCDDYLAKPIVRQELKRVLDRWMVAS